MSNGAAVESRSDYGIVIAKDVMIPMRDGVELAADIYRPAESGDPISGAFPTILGRTAYDKSNNWLWVDQVADYFTRRGYVVVLQDVRGRGASEGLGHYFHTDNENEGKDGYDTVEWIAAQPWSNGRIGTVGSSHGSIVQQIMALHRPPHLTTIWADAGPTNNYARHIREGGAMKLMMFGALFLHAHDAQELRHDPSGKRAIQDGMLNMRDLVARQPFKPGLTPLAAVPNLETTLFNYYWRGDYDEWWKQEWHNQEAQFARHADIPAVFSGGWYDPFSSATTEYFTAMRAQNKSHQRLIMGPWTHYGIFFGYGFAGDVDLGPDAAWGFERYNLERLRWFDHWLKDEPTRIDEEPPVLLFVMGGGSGRRNAKGKLDHGGYWRTEQEWPLSRAKHKAFFLRASGELTERSPKESEPPLGFSYDPRHPVPTIAGSVAGFFEVVPVPAGIEPFFEDWVPLPVRMRNIVTDGGAHQQEQPGVVGASPPYLPLAARPDVLVFQTAPLEHDVEVTGPIVVTLWVASSALDTDFTAKLLDVYPPNEDYPQGYHLNLVDSIMRARYRNGWESPELLEPHQPFEIKISLPPTSNLFQAGHRIRLDLSSSSFPLFDLNPNTGEPIGRHTRVEIAHQTVFVDADRPSRVSLPIIP